MCYPVATFPPLEHYLPKRKEVISSIYELCSTILSSGIVYNISQALLSCGGYFGSFLCYKLTDYFGDLFLKGKLSEEQIDFIKTAVKVAGTALVAFVSVVMFGYRIEVLLVCFGLYLICSSILKLTDPLEWCFPAKQRGKDLP